MDREIQKCPCEYGFFLKRVLEKGEKGMGLREFLISHNVQTHKLPPCNFFLIFFGPSTPCRLDSKTFLQWFFLLA